MSVWPWRDHIWPEEARALAKLDAELAPLLDCAQAIRARRNRIINRAISRARQAARKKRDVSRVSNTNHMIDMS